MKQILTLFTVGLLFGLAQAQTKVETADFARRPQFYQGQTILIRNVSISTGNVISNDQVQSRSRQRPNPNINKSNEKSWDILSTPPRCNPASGWTLINPTIPNLKTPLCFAVRSKIYSRLPQNKSFNADIVIEVDVRGISQIKRIRILK